MTRVSICRALGTAAAAIALAACGGGSHDGARAKRLLEMARPLLANARFVAGVDGPAVRHAGYRHVLLHALAVWESQGGLPAIDFDGLAARCGWNAGDALDAALLIGADVQGHDWLLVAAGDWSADRISACYQKVERARGSPDSDARRQASKTRRRERPRS